MTFIALPFSLFEPREYTPLPSQTQLSYAGTHAYSHLFTYFSRGRERCAEYGGSATHPLRFCKKLNAGTDGRGNGVHQASLFPARNKGAPRVSLLPAQYYPQNV